MTTSGGTRTSSSAWSWLCSGLRRLGQVGEGLAALLYPPGCASCGRDLSRLRVLCPDCEAALPSLSGPRCEVCGEDLDDPTLDLCLDCGTRDRGLDRIAALGPYEGPWGDLVRALKFEGERAVGRYLGQRLATAAREAFGLEGIDAITYVPMTRAERRKRGFNQAEVLARRVAVQLRLPLLRSLRKVETTVGQAGLPAARRRDNLRGAFRAIPSKSARVLLIDDICTTGSTAEECAKTLRSAGFARVSVLVVARA